MRAKPTTCCVVFLAVACVMAASVARAETNAALFARVAPVVCALAAKDWPAAAREAVQARQQLADHAAAPLVDGVPLGFYLAYWHGVAQRRVRHQAPRALVTLKEASALLQHSDQGYQASNVWADLYYELGQSYRVCGRFFDAERFLAASASMGGGNTQTWLRARLALINLDLRRSRYASAFAAMTNIWAMPALRTKEAHYIYAIVCFSQRRNREACEALIDGLSRFGVSPRLAERDPLYRAFLDHLGRASDAHIAAFYDLLRLQLEVLPLEQGYERTAALLICQRALLARCYPFLRPHDDARMMDERFAVEQSMADVGGPCGDDALLDDLALEEL